jgi:hypothetical protein
MRQKTAVAYFRSTYYSGNWLQGLSKALKIYLPKSIRGFEPISYRGALLSTFLHATVYVLTQSAECTSTDCK